MMNLKDKEGQDSAENKRLAAGIPAIPNNNVQKDTLYNLFLAHLLRPKEWTA